MGEGDTLYEKVVDVTYRYLGPAADRFVSRQIQSHLNKKPEQLHEEDLDDLVAWFSVAMGLLSEDAEMVKRFESELMGLADQA